MSLLRNVIGVILVIAVVVGIQYWNKASSYKDAKAQMLEFCGGATKCETALSEHFDTCFNRSYHLGSRRRADSLDHAAFAHCVNSKGGSDMLTLNQ